MNNFENLQTNSENRAEKQYYIPMEVTPETVKDFGINPAFEVKNCDLKYGIDFELA